MSPDISIRTMQYPQDYPACAEIWRSSGPGIVFSPSDAPEEIEKLLSYHPELFLVAEHGSRVVGTVIGGFDGRRGMVYHLAVRKEYQGQGIGSRLLQEVEGRLAGLGCLKSYLMVTADNLDTAAFYETKGWKMMKNTIFGKELDPPGSRR